MSGFNYPLRGGKYVFCTPIAHSFLACSNIQSIAFNWSDRYTLFEGGTRVSAFISGGAVPAAVRGTTTNAMIHEV
jgi:hypothetical protein